MPAHIVRYLTDIGRIDADGVTRKARVRFCTRPNCHAIIIRGLDHDRCAAAVSVDPLPLSALGEAEVLLSGGRTFELSGRVGHYRIDVRNSFHIAGHPAGTTGGDVVAEHRCGVPPPSGHAESRIPSDPPPSSQESFCPPF